MPWAGQSLHAPPHPGGPALFLYPTNDSFVPKMISLAPSGNRVKIGRQTNTKTVPGERNGYFDSKVLSRQHAEVWEESGKIFIKDVKSSNGTFVNGERLSVEGMESEPWELKSDDRVEFGIDIVGEDNKTIIHHKVAATVFCVLTPDDYTTLLNHFPSLQHHGQYVNGAHHMQGQGQRRPSLQQAPSPIGLGGLGGGPGLGLSGRSGKSGLTFDHILNRLQNELQKSRETGSELNSLTSAMNDLSDNLSGGALPPSIQSHHNLPPVRPPAPPSEIPPSSSDLNVNLTSIQTQLLQTQSALATHADKVKSLESVITEHEHVKHELQAMRELMEQRKLEMDTMISHSRLQANGNHHLKEDEDSDQDDRDDARSVLTIVPDEGESSHSTSVSRDFAQEQRNRFEDDEDQGRTEGLRPRTPEPHGMGMNDDDDESDGRPMRRQFDASALMDSSTDFTTYPIPSSESDPAPSSSSIADAERSADQPSTAELHSQHEILATRLETVSQQLDSAVSLSRQLHSQSEAAQRSIELLEAKVQSLEALVEQTKAEQAQRHAEQTTAEDERREDATKQHVILNEAWETWRLRVEGQWRTEREGWEQERLRLQDTLRQWETRMAEIEQRDQRRSTESSELIAALQREREESALAWKRREESLQRFLDAQLSDEERDTRPTARMVNGTMKGANHNGNNNKNRRGTSSSPAPKPTKSKKRRSSANAVATPPHSPTMNGSVITERSSEASGSRSTSPDASASARLSMVDAFANGHIKPELLPLSPAPSVRTTGTRTGSIASEPDSADDLQPTPSVVGHLAPPSPNPAAKGAGGQRTRRLRENPMPYISVSVVFIGLAAWAFASRAKD